ncbi:PREDICTED: uncharacterized protein LOC108374716 [Rhagoletis zephyria]|uniref:uncharacterized protein LOC108374716 n=1 Tax=Rhagoletis zephyria TaxID=28612 RepID=UPI000811A28D|nr:PREDICTED: uncharacterized protein LOC108374716 [Rhagoletis zephyria]
MSTKNRETRVHIVSTPLNLPLFLSERTSFRHDNRHTIPSYIKKKRQFFTKHCIEDKDIETRNERDLKNRVGIYSPRVEPCTDLHITKMSRDLAKDKPWQLPPNTYDISKEPYGSKRGYLGSYWRKIPQKMENIYELRSKPEGPSNEGQWRFYELPRDTERFLSPANKHKGIFLTNARDRRATARCMISNPSMIYRNPSEPSPAHYDPLLHELAYNVSPQTQQEFPNPHIFLPHTCVPEKPMSHIRRHTSFEPAVGRYEVRYPKHCPCGKKNLTPGLRLIIEREKRLKFRRLPYRKINVNRHCSPDWDHVIGGGHRHLFQTKGKARVPTRKKTPERRVRSLLMFPDSKYINMINSPHREYLSIRPGGMPTAPMQIRFNCISKRVIRRQLRINKKIVFNSGSERFPDLDIRPVMFTATQLERLKQSLPPERQLRDYPVMRKRLSEITSQLHKTPAHMKPAYEPKLRKRLFKFQPLPEPKVLVSEKELLPSTMLSPELKFFYGKPVNPYDFMKGGVLKAASLVRERTSSRTLSQTQSLTTSRAPSSVTINGPEDIPEM